MKAQKAGHLLVFDTVADWEPGLAIAHLNQSAPGMPSKYRVRSVGLSQEPVVTKGGLRILPELKLEELSATHSALLILPGADIWAEPKTDRALEKVKVFAEAGVPEFLASSGYAGARHYVTEPAVEDDGVITAPATASLEFARHVLEKLQVYSPSALDAWYGLFRTGKPEHYFAFVQALKASVDDGKQT